MVTTLTRDRGFTLFELIVAMSIVGLLTVGGILSLSSTDPLKLAAAFEKLEADVRYAQHLAMSSHETCGVKFFPEKNAYYVFVQNHAKKATDPVTGADLVVDYSSDKKYRGVTLVRDNFGNTISFDYLGVPYESTNTPLTSQGIVQIACQGETKTLYIKEETGYIDAK